MSHPGDGERAHRCAQNSPPLGSTRCVRQMSAGEVLRREVRVQLQGAGLVIPPPGLKFEPVLVEVGHGRLEAVQLPAALCMCAEP